MILLLRSYVTKTLSFTSCCLLGTHYVLIILRLQIVIISSTSIFSNPSIELFPSDSDTSTFDELYSALPHALTSSTEDDLPVGDALDNYELSSTSSSVSPVDVPYDIVESTNEPVVPSLSHPTQVRLVVKGLTLEYGINYEETFTLVAHLTSTCSLLTIITIRRWKLFQMDVKNIFLNVDLEKEVYMKPPPRLNHPSNKVCRLRCALYDLKQSPQAWYAKFNAIVNDGYLLSQVKYAFDLASKAKLNDSKSVFTPLKPHVKLTPIDGSPLSDPTRYWQLVSSLVYLTMTCLDIAYAIHIVSQFITTPRSTHYAVVLYTICYVQGALFHGLHFSINSSLLLCAYSNVNWASDPSDCRSTTGYCPFVGILLSPSRARNKLCHLALILKLRDLDDITSKLLSLQWLLQDMGIPQPSSTDLYCDNQNAIQMAYNDVFHEHTKHIKVNCHFIHHHVAKETIHLIFISSIDQLANWFTKSHFPRCFQNLLSKIKLISSPPP
ncbi:hypothetical protein SLEP1_g54522 [Rubroshorea leprosula]|uniref:Reverse transcriptase Ty1/copia-type domain-containing protein n=1 Tax=Rubroshorea leprosula TaxID=152421 RepID=A0AAV5MDT9_9ROSI|nr:hypothetical protein SLEP1_g54522 [Rubroshorea leprosula]